MLNASLILAVTGIKRISYSILSIVLIFLLADANAQTLVADAGSSTTICPGVSIQLGGNPAATGGSPPYTFSWQPAAVIDNPASSNPNALTAAPTNFTLTVTDAGGNTAQDSITISLFPKPTVYAGPDQTILSGTNTTLQATGIATYYWLPDQYLTNAFTATPIAVPVSTTTYCVGGTDENGCDAYDCMVLEVIQSDRIIIYNAFSPNGDGINDLFFIGNITNFPENKLEVFNRNGELVFQADGYTNDWNGRIEGADLPAATYYVVLDLGKGKRKVSGAVTIIR